MYERNCRASPPKLSVFESKRGSGSRASCQRNNTTAPPPPGSEFVASLPNLNLLTVIVELRERSWSEKKLFQC